MTCIDQDMERIKLLDLTYKCFSRAFTLDVA